PEARPLLHGLAVLEDRRELIVCVSRERRDRPPRGSRSPGARGVGRPASRSWMRRDFPDMTGGQPRNGHPPEAARESPSGYWSTKIWSTTILRWPDVPA